MAMIKEKRYDEQQSRMVIFPTNRIPFYSSETSAYCDKKTFEAYMRKEITKETAMRRIAENNSLYQISEEQFDNEYHLLGYDFVATQEVIDDVEWYRMRKKK